MKKTAPILPSLPKSPTGIRGLDEITNGGLPLGRPTLLCGAAGCGKTLMAMEFLVHGVRDYGEPGVFMAFEESGEALAANVASLGFDVQAMIADGKLLIDHVRLERSEIEESGDYDLEGLFIRLDHAIRSTGAKRVVLDTVEALFGGLPNPSLLRAELRRLFRWLGERGVTSIITGERGDGLLTRYGIEEYVSDCVIVLDHRVTDQMSVRRVRIAKYRGSAHGTNEYPFLIDELGISILPLTSMNLAHRAPTGRIPTGIPQLDAMLGGEGYYRGSSILVTGTAGSGKTSVSAHFVDEACRRGERCLYFLFEESPEQMMRNMRSIGIDLQRWVKKGLLQFHAARPSLTGLEMHLSVTLKLIRDFSPEVVVVDPISAFASFGNEFEIKSLLVRLIDTLKSNGITSLFTSLTAGEDAQERTDSVISSLIDTWLLLRDLEMDGERNRALYLVKSRGMAHSNQVREFVLTSKGVRLADVYIGPAGVLTGSARSKQESLDRNEATASMQARQRKEEELERRRRALRNQIAVLEDETRAAEAEAALLQSQNNDRAQQAVHDKAAFVRLRQPDAPGADEDPASKRGKNDEAVGRKSSQAGNGRDGRGILGTTALRGRSDRKVRDRIR